MPLVDLLNHRHPARVDHLAVELREPWPQVVRDAVRDPEADLVIALDGVLPAVLVLEAHAEDADDGLAAHRCAILLAVLAVCPRRHQAGPALAVGEERRSQFADGLHIEFAETRRRRRWQCSLRWD